MDNRNNKRGFMTLLGIVTSVATIISLISAVLIIMDRKKKKDDRELEEYLEAAIN